MSTEETIWLLGIDGDGALSTLDAINAALATVLETMSQVVAGAADLSGLDEALSSVGATADEASTGVEGLDEMMSQLQATIAEDTTIIDTLNESVVNLQAQIDMLTASEAGSEAEAGALAAALAGLGDMADTAGAALEAAQGPLMMLSAGALMAGGAFMKMGMQGQDGIALVQGMAGATTGDIQSLEQEALKLGENMDEASQGFYQIESAGYAGKDGIEVFDNAVKTAKGSQSQLKDVSSALTSVLHGYNLTADDSGKVTDEMTKTVKVGRQSFQDYASAIGPLASVAANLGISFDQVNAAEATMTQINPKVKQDSTDLQHMMTALASDTHKLAGAAGKLGIHFDETHYKSLDLIGKLEYLKQQCGNNQTAFTKLIGGVTGLAAAHALLAGNTETYTSNLKALQNSQGATDQSFATSQATISASMDKIGAAMSVFATRTIEALGPKLMPILDGLATAIGHVADFISAHMDIVMPILAGLAVFFGVIIVSAIAAFVASVWTVISPFLAVAAVIGAVVAAVIYAIEHWGGITDWLKGVWAGFLAWYNGILAGIKEKWAGLESFFKGLWAGIVANSKTAWDGVNNAAHTAGDNLKTWWAGVVSGFEKSPIGGAIIQSLQGGLSQVGQQFGQIGQQIHTQLGTALSGVLPALGNLGNSFHQIWLQLVPVGQVIGGAFMTAWKALQVAFAAVGHALASIPWGTLGAALAQVGSIIGGAFTSAWKALAPIFAQIGGMIGGQILNALKLLGVIIGGVVLIAISAFLGAIVGLARGLATFIQGIAMIITGIVQVFSGIAQIFSGIAAFIVDLVTGHFNKLGTDLGVIWNGVKTMFEGVWNIIKGIFLTTVGTLISFISGFVSTVITFFASLASSVGIHVSGMVTNVINFFRDLPQNVLNFLNNLPGMIVNLWNTIITDATNAGTNIVKGIASGITNAIHFVTDAITGVTKWISDHLPHSPAKEGPLRDLAYQGSMITDQISEGMVAGMPKLQAALGQITQPITAQLNPQVNTGLVPATATGVPNQGGNDQQVQYLAQIAAYLAQMLQLQQQRQSGHTTNNIGVGAINNQALNQLIQSLSGFGYESTSRGVG